MDSHSPEFARIISEVSKHCNAEHIDVIWAGFDSRADLIDQWQQLSKRVLTGDQDALEKLILWFAPTSVLQELSIANGWADEYLEIAERFDTFLNHP